MTAAVLRGEVYAARLGWGEGSEQSGTRPVLIVGNDLFNEVMPVLTVVPLTTRRPGRELHPAEVLVSKGETGLRAESIALAHQIRTIARSRIGRRVGRLDEQAMALVSAALRLHLAV